MAGKRKQRQGGLELRKKVGRKQKKHIEDVMGAIVKPTVLRGFANANGLKMKTIVDDYHKTLQNVI